jgi:hypothetical protein
MDPGRDFARCKGGFGRLPTVYGLNLQFFQERKQNDNLGMA